MEQKQHVGPFNNCPLCVAKVAKLENIPEKATYLRYRRGHHQSVSRRLKDQSMRDLGLTKVKGASGKVYWE